MAAKKKLQKRIYIYCNKNSLGWQVKLIALRPDKRYARSYHAECWAPEGAHQFHVGSYVAITGTRQAIPLHEV